MVPHPHDDGPVERGVSLSMTAAVEAVAACGWRIATQPRNPLRLSSLVILGVVARMSRCATRSSYWFT